MRFPFFRNRDSVKNGILISIRRTGDGFHPGLFMPQIRQEKKRLGSILEAMKKMLKKDLQMHQKQTIML